MDGVAVAESVDLSNATSSARRLEFNAGVRVIARPGRLEYAKT
jgi:hypothetical protein